MLDLRAGKKLLMANYVGRYWYVKVLLQLCKSVSTRKQWPAGLQHTRWNPANIVQERSFLCVTHFMFATTNKNTCKKERSLQKCCCKESFLRLRLSPQYQCLRDSLYSTEALESEDSQDVLPGQTDGQDDEKPEVVVPPAEPGSGDGNNSDSKDGLGQQQIQF